ncbi:MAG: polyphosphate:nucleotide phosphotransferase, family [Armatimonadetes bacterium]|jgi:PPK2 family polyphosphate:nucleotide phosphotransferase|nr:polyphosphate:nucleotide phosphotransferase, family [Armatimonadota bacterium]
MQHDRFIRRPGETLRLDQLDPAATGEFESEEAAAACEQDATQRMVRAQDRLMAHEQHGLLILFQGMDASGKDESIRDVLSSLDPRASEFKQFQKMTKKELRHDFLWRAAAALPARGQVGIFNRSYYEQVIGERVHPERLEDQRLPDYALEDVWNKRFRHINHFEQYLVENGIHVLKFFLHVSKEQQRLRLLERIEAPETCWDFSQSDIEARARWDDYMRVYEETLSETSTEHAPWYLLPADHRWFVRAIVASIVADKLESLHAGYPEPDPKEREVLEAARKSLEEEA